MATKKKTKTKTKKRVPKEKIRAESPENDAMRLSRAQLLEYRALEAEARATAAEAGWAGSVLQRLLDQSPAIVEADAKVKEANVAARGARVTYHQFMSALSEKLGFDMTKVAIDDKTGSIQTLPGPD